MKGTIFKNLMQVFTGSILIIQTAFAQGYYENAVRYGQNSIYGSVKSMGMGGVQISTGGDATSLATNPAGAAMMRKSEFQLSLMPVISSTSSSFLSGTTDASKFRAPIGSFSLALNSLKDDIQAGSFRGGTFTLSYNRTAIFDRKSTWEGVDKLSKQPGDTSANSIIDYYLNALGNTPASDVLSSNSSFPGSTDINLAYNTYLLDVDKSRNQFVSVIPLGNVSKSGYYDQSFSQGMWNAGYSANILDKFYIGASLAYYTCDYKAEVQYAEQLNNVVVNPNNSQFIYLQGFNGFNFQITKDVTQTAKGISGNIGGIYKVTDGFRFGASIQLPGYMWLKESSNSTYSASYNGIAYWGNSADPNDSLNYNLGTEIQTQGNDYNWKMSIPAKYRLGTTYVFGKLGMIGIDLEYTDLSSARLSEGDGNYNFSQENNLIRTIYQPTLNVKVGGEMRFEDLRLRLGYGYVPTALKSSALAYRNNINSDAHYITGGLGGRYEVWYWDAAVVLGFWNTKYKYYSAGPNLEMPEASTNVQSTQLRLGIGFYF